MYRSVKRFPQMLENAGPRYRQILHGAGLALDPCPFPRYRTFERSDEGALWADWSAVGEDMMRAFAVARHERKRASR